MHKMQAKQKISHFSSLPYHHKFQHKIGMVLYIIVNELSMPFRVTAMRVLNWLKEFLETKDEQFWFVRCRTFNSISSQNTFQLWTAIKHVRK